MTKHCKQKLIELKKEFYSNPLHWSNNKRRMHGLPVLRGKSNNKYRTNFWCYNKYKTFELIEETINGLLLVTINDYFESFVDVKEATYE